MGMMLALNKSVQTSPNGRAWSSSWTYRQPEGQDAWASWRGLKVLIRPLWNLDFRLDHLYRRDHHGLPLSSPPPPEQDTG